ncbi:MAG: adhesin [Bacteroidales bacterium 45-6]|nr:MAG: adhesin [Bacteroidales bacterium 45-6]
MKRLNLLSILSAGLLALSTTSCENQDQSFPDYDTQTVYFSYQSPIRTITLGEDIYDTSPDNAHKCQIYATWSGGYSNNSDVKINIVVDESLCDNLYYADGSKIKPMPANYYKLAANEIIIPKGSISGGVEVQLTDAFFADPAALTTTYVIPVRMTGVSDGTTILTGKAKATVTNPVLTNAVDWEVLPKNFVMYAVKYINTWEGYYLRRGKDAITKDGVNSAVVRHSKYVENDAVWKLTSLSLSSIRYPMDYKNKLGNDLNFALNLNFTGDNCAVTAPTTMYQVNDSVKVYDIVVSGQGKFVKDGEVKSWGNQDRDGIYLTYQTSYKIEIKYPKAGLQTETQSVAYNTSDTLVARNRGVTIGTFEYAKK